MICVSFVLSVIIIALQVALTLTVAELCSLFREKFVTIQQADVPRNIISALNLDTLFNCLVIWNAGR